MTPTHIRRPVLPLLGLAALALGACDNTNRGTSSYGSSGTSSSYRSSGTGGSGSNAAPVITPNDPSYSQSGSPRAGAGDPSTPSQPLYVPLENQRHR